MRFFSVVLFSLILVSISGVVFAQQTPSSISLSVNPQIFKLDVFPGETIKNKIWLKNLSDVSLPIKVKVTDFTAQEISGEMEFDQSLQDPSIASRKWFKIEKPNFILDSKEKEKVNFEIFVPGNAEPGGHYSTILFEPQLPSFYFKPGQIRTIPVIGVLFMISVKTFNLEPEAHQKLEIVEFSIPKKERLLTLEDFSSKLLGSVVQAASEFTITKEPPSKFILQIKNNDIYHIRPYGKVLIYNIFGKKVAETEVPKRTILPGKIREFPIEFSLEIPEILKWLPASISNFLVQNFFFGRYQAELFLEAETPLKAEAFQPGIASVLTFVSLPWKFWLGFLVGLGILMFFGIKYRKRIKLSLKTLITPKF